MLYLNDFFKETPENDHISINSGKGIIYDTQQWIEKYRKHLENSGKSRNTIELYRVTLDAFKIYVARYLYKCEGLSNISIPDINEFLEWMEEYKTSSKYGSIKERIDYLIKYISFTGVSTYNEYSKNISAYFVDMDDDMVEMNGYILEDFGEFFKNSIHPISKELIQKYIDSRPKASNATMEQRRIALIAFFGFIDKASREERFGPEMWRVKMYKKTKKANEHIAGFSIDDEKKIRKELLLAPEKSISLLKKVRKGSEYCEWRNRAMIVLMMEAGLRSMEALNLKFTDIKEEVAKDEEGKEMYILKVLGKGNKERRVPIVKEKLQTYVEYLSENRRGEYLSSTESGSPMHRVNLYNAVKIKLTSAGVSRAGLHIFRHHFGSSFALKENSSMTVLQTLLGHSSISTTMVYSKLSDEHLTKAVAR